MIFTKIYNAFYCSKKTEVSTRVCQLYGGSVIFLAGVINTGPYGDTHRIFVRHHNLDPDPNPNTDPKPQPNPDPNPNTYPNPNVTVECEQYTQTVNSGIENYVRHSVPFKICIQHSATESKRNGLQTVISQCHLCLAVGGWIKQTNCSLSKRRCIAVVVSGGMNGIGIPYALHSSLSQDCNSVGSASIKYIFIFQLYTIYSG